MEIAELKNKIENKLVTSEFMIWKYSDETSLFIMDQYYHAIARFRKLGIKLVDHIGDIPEESFIQ